MSNYHQTVKPVSAPFSSVRAATPLPLVVIGGITPPRAAALYAAGADGLCVGAAIVRAADPEAAARAFFEPSGA